MNGAMVNVAPMSGLAPMSGYLTSSACTAFYLQFELEPVPATN